VLTLTKHRYQNRKRAIEEPLRQIVANAGGEGSVIVAKVAEGTGDFGYNAKTDEYVKCLKQESLTQLK
jgi:chaperonin GroEL